MSEWVVLMPVVAVRTWVIVSIVIAVLLVVGLVVLSIYGKKLQDRQEESQKQLQAAAQNASFLVIDKKKMRLRESGLPQAVIAQAPKRFRGQKVPIVKVKIGSQIMSLMCDEKVFEQIPVRKSVRAKVSGIYILEVRGLRSNLEARPVKRSLRARLQDKLMGMQQKTEEPAKKAKAKK